VSIVPMTDMQAIEQITMTGDLSRLTAEQRVAYVKYVCDSLGLNAATRPFEFQMFQGKLVMYAKKDCTEQLRKIHGVSIRVLERKTDTDNGVFTVSVRGIDKTGRRDESTGAVGIAGLRGMELANAMMKAETKAKRRLTLSICGLGFLDESDIADGGAASAPVRVSTTDQLRRLNALAQGTVTAPSTEAVAAPAAAPVEESEPRPATAALGWEQQLGQPATDGGPAEPTLEDLAEQVAALARQAGGKRTAMQALAKAKKDGKDEAGTRRVLEEWHEALSNTINKESMQ
jgi:hypothetical protein